MNKHYIPIACALHDRYEIAIMRKTRIEIAWIDEAGRACQGAVMPQDIVVKNSEEFLLFFDMQGNESLIRLDHITLAEQ